MDDYIAYYNNERYQWHLAKLSPNEYYQFCMTGKYPLKIAHPPALPVAEKNRMSSGENKKIAPALALKRERSQGTSRWRHNVRAALDKIMRITLACRSGHICFPVPGKGGSGRNPETTNNRVTKTYNVSHVHSYGSVKKAVQKSGY